VAVEQIALDRLAQSGGAAGAVRLPAGEKTSEQPIGKCGSSGNPVRCSATTSGSVACSTRAALR